MKKIKKEGRIAQWQRFLYVNLTTELGIFLELLKNGVPLTELVKNGFIAKGDKTDLDILSIRELIELIENLEVAPPMWPDRRSEIVHGTLRLKAKDGEIFHIGITHRYVAFVYLSLPSQYRPERLRDLFREVSNGKYKSSNKLIPENPADVLKVPNEVPN